MKTHFDKLNIKKIYFETGESDVTVKAKVISGNLSYDSEIIIDFSDLNLLLNQMQKVVNDEIQLSSLFESEKMYNGNLLYTLEIEKQIEESILIEKLSFNNPIKQIRA
jgi:hypothetical protein